MKEQEKDDPFARLQESLDREMEKFYSKKTIEYSKNPVNIGRMENADGSAAIKGGCGDTMEIYLRIKGGIIENVRFFTDGCGVTLACGSAVTQLVKGKTIQEAMKISPNTVIEELGGLPDDGLHCAILSVSTLLMALGDYFLKTE